jgi:uncharacterized membrane protein
MPVGKRFGQNGANSMNRAFLHRINRACLPLGWAAAVAAPFVTHAALATGRFANEAALLALVQIAVLGVLTLRGLRGWQRIAAAAGVAALLAGLGVRLFRPGPAGLIATSGLSHTCIYLSLLFLFSRSLRPGRTALITGLAARLRGMLTPEIEAYTRNVTKAWCVFFTMQLAISMTLLAWAPVRVWSLFVNVLDAPMVGAMFAAEYAIRRWRFRGQRHISPVATLRRFARDRAP